MSETRPGPDTGGERPESLAQFARSARQKNSDHVPEPLQADEHTAPIPTSNRDKHQVATELFNKVRSKWNRTLKTLASRSCLIASSTAGRAPPIPLRRVRESHGDAGTKRRLAD